MASGRLTAMSGASQGYFAACDGLARAGIAGCGRLVVVHRCIGRRTLALDFLTQVDPLVELARVHAILDRLDALDSTVLADDVLLEYLRGKERMRRGLAGSDHAAIQELERRNLPANSCVSTVSMLRRLLRIDAHEASAHQGCARRWSASGVDR